MPRRTSLRRPALAETTLWTSANVAGSATRGTCAARLPTRASRGRLANVFYSMDTTGSDFYAHQFRPVVRLNFAGRGILIADEVGLGKTIEAGLLWTELRTRFNLWRLVVLCPAVLREKWRRELRQRFGVAADVLGARETRDLRFGQCSGSGRARPLSAEPRGRFLPAPCGCLLSAASVW